MGHIFVLCGPPGAGKTTFLKAIKQKNLPFEQLQRITTRASRKEEGDKGKSTLEYEFLSNEEFAGRLSRGDIVNFIEWNGNFYATDIHELNRAFHSDRDFILFEDIPSAVALKHRYGSLITVMLMYTDDQVELEKIEFAAMSSERSSIIEWKRRLELKYDDSVKIQNKSPSETERQEYISKKMSRSIHDLAFIAGKIRKSEDIRVLANRKDKLDEAIQQFLNLSQEVKENRFSNGSEGKFAFVLMPFKDDFNKLYSFVIKPSIESKGLSCLRGDEIFTQLNIVNDIMKHIEASKLIISDITGGNPNVFLELGVSINLNKPIVLITQDSDAPFHVKNCRWIKYENTLKGWENLAREISDVVDKVKNKKDIGSQLNA